MVYTRKALDISNLPMRKISFMTQHANIFEIKEGEKQDRNVPECLKKATRELHNWLLHLRLPLGQFCLDVRVIIQAQHDPNLFLYLPHTHSPLAPLFSLSGYNYPLSGPT